MRLYALKIREGIGILGGRFSSTLKNTTLTREFVFVVRYVNETGIPAEWFLKFIVME